MHSSMPACAPASAVRLSRINTKIPNPANIPVIILFTIAVTSKESMHETAISSMAIHMLSLKGEGVLKSDLWTHKLTMAADLPDEPIPGRPLVEIIDHSRVLIENHKGVTEYGCNLIRVKVKFGSICICGSNLELSRMTKGQLIITGDVDAIQLCRG